MHNISYRTWMESAFMLNWVTIAPSVQWQLCLRCVSGEGVDFVYTWISYRAKDNPNIEPHLSLQPCFCAVSTVTLHLCTFLSQWTATIAKKVFVWQQSRGFIPLALTSKWSSVLSDTQRHMANQSKEGFSCCPSGLMTQRSRPHVRDWEVPLRTSLGNHG